jgi:uncharacterized protein (TIGR02757 family)
MIDKKGSIGKYFLQGYDPEDPDIGPSLIRFIDGLKRLDARRSWESENGSPGFRHLLPSPSHGSTCKRLNMFLRWMVRPSDGIDLGLWSDMSPCQLVMPVDTHVARICRHLKLAQRKTTDWKFALEVTHSLRTMDANDPIRYDFAISHWAIVNGWTKVREEINESMSQ